MARSTWSPTAVTSSALALRYGSGSTMNSAARAVTAAIPAHASALGKALLAFTSSGTPKVPLRSMTGETVTDPAVLATQLDTVRATGIANEVEEAVIGECALQQLLLMLQGRPSEQSAS
ncbi:MAG: IclR family transcriptional regulator domain-containing protein [Mycobacterium sp.]